MELTVFQQSLFAHHIGTTQATNGWAELLAPDRDGCSVAYGVTKKAAATKHHTLSGTDVLRDEEYFDV